MVKQLLPLCFVIIFVGCSQASPPVPTGNPPPISDPVSTPSPVPAKTVTLPASPTSEPLAGYWPTQDWGTATPEQQGMDGARLTAMHDTLPTDNIHTLLVVRNGYIVWEYYAPGYNRHSLLEVHSVTKSFTGALVGIAIEKGLIEGVEQKITDFFPEIDAPNGDPRKKSITIYHLLTHTSGLDWPEWQEWEGMPQPLFDCYDCIHTVLDRPMITEPGEAFNYNSGGSFLLGAIIQKATGWENSYTAGGMTLKEYAQSRLFEPLGIRRFIWKSVPQGITNGADEMYLTARDMAKFGYLYLRQGTWEDQQIVPETWVTESTRSHITTVDNDEYGYHWWVASEAGQTKLYFASGYGGQIIFVYPEQDLVVVITGDNPESPEIVGLYLDQIIEAIQPTE